MAVFGGEYQGGSFVEVLGCQGSNPAQHCKVVGSQKSFQKEYDKLLKGYLYSMSGSACKIHMPKDEKKQLGLTQPFLVAQVSIAEGPFLLELQVTDNTSQRRRLILSSSVSEAKITPFHCQLPVQGLRPNTWANLTVAMAELTATFFRGFTFRSLDSMTLGACGKLRRIFTLKEVPPSPGYDGLVSHLALPKGYEYPPGTENISVMLDSRCAGRRLVAARGMPTCLSSSRVF